jgi:hypothetical protein
MTRLDPATVPDPSATIRRLQRHAEVARVKRDWVPRGVLDAISTIDRIALVGRSQLSNERRSV